MSNHIKINDRLNRLFNEYDEEIDILEQRLEASKKVGEGWLNQLKASADTDDLQTIKLVINNIINKDYGLDDNISPLKIVNAHEVWNDIILSNK